LAHYKVQISLSGTRCSASRLTFGRFAFRSHFISRGYLRVSLFRVFEQQPHGGVNIRYGDCRHRPGRWSSSSTYDRGLEWQVGTGSIPLYRPSPINVEWRNRPGLAHDLEPHPPSASGQQFFIGHEQNGNGGSHQAGPTTFVAAAWSLNKQITNNLSMSFYILDMQNCAYSREEYTYSENRDGAVSKRLPQQDQDEHNNDPGVIERSKGTHSHTRHKRAS
jgi:hypothetical protein